MIRNNATASNKNNSQMHKVELKEQEESNNVQPKASSVVNRPSSQHQVVQTGQVDAHASSSGITGPSRSNDSEDAAYVYRDFAQEEDPTERINANYAGHSSLISHEDETTRSLASQKLPAKLAAMLSDPDLITCITWLPHGRSWKILNRDLFSSYALPRYFGHTNHSSFVRVVNAWGFRRIISGPDRDSYYHELFLRGKSSLYSRMKRLPNNSTAGSGGGRKSASSQQVVVNRRRQQQLHQEKSLDFYEISKNSPLPENTWQYRPQAMNNGGVGSGRMGGAGGGHPSLGAFGAGGGMGGMMGGMVPAAAIGMHQHHAGNMAAAAYHGGGGGMAPPNPMMGGSFAGPGGAAAWNVPGPGGASGATAGMMGMNRRPMSLSFDGSAGGGVGGPDSISRGVHNSTSSSRQQNTPQLLAAAALRQAPNPNETSAGASSELQSLMNQNKLLQTLLVKTQAAVVAAASVAGRTSGGGSGGASGGGGGGYPYVQAQQHYNERGSTAAPPGSSFAMPPPAGGGGNDGRSGGP